MLSHIADVIGTCLLADSPDFSDVHTMLENDLLLSAEERQSLLYQIIKDLNGEPFPPITQLELILTEACNLACTYCFEKNMLGCRRMSAEIAHAAVDLLFDYSGNKEVLSITYFGGEPTMNFAAVRQITEYAEQKASALGKTIGFNMTSNGTLFTEPIAEYCYRHNIKVLLSIDGLEATHDQCRVDKRGRGTFWQVMNGLKVLKASQPWIAAKMTIMPQNVSRLVEDVLGLYKMGVNQFIIGHATGVQWPADAIESYKEQLGKLYEWYTLTPRHDMRITEVDNGDDSAVFGCRAGSNSISIAVNGEISPCSKVLALNNKQLLGKLGEVRVGITHIRHRSELMTCSQLRAACEAQGIAEGFRDGCFAANYEDTGDLFQPSTTNYVLSMIKRSASRAAQRAMKVA